MALSSAQCGAVVNGADVGPIRTFFERHIKPSDQASFEAVKTKLQEVAPIST